MSRRMWPGFESRTSQPVKPVVTLLELPGLLSSGFPIYKMELERLFRPEPASESASLQTVPAAEFWIQQEILPRLLASWTASIPVPELQVLGAEPEASCEGMWLSPHPSPRLVALQPPRSQAVRVSPSPSDCCP